MPTTKPTIKPTILHDWRGNTYNKNQTIGKCEFKGCKNKAKRQPCLAEREIGRTHWHGRVHVKTKDGFKLMALCDKHNKVLCSKHNTEMIKRLTLKERIQGREEG